MDPRDLQVLCLLGRHIDRAGWCTRSQVKMSKEINIGRATLQRALDRLYAAGWVEKARRDGEAEDSDVQPSRSYAYRVRLDRDDYALDGFVRGVESDDEPSHAENASEGEKQGGVPINGHPVENAEGAHLDGHQGARSERARGAHAYTGTKNDPLERPLKERERDARANDRKERFLTRFKAKWPTAAVDDQQRLRYAAQSLTELEEAEALNGIEPFLALLKTFTRKAIPAGFTYLEEKRWTLLKSPEAAAAAAPSTRFAADSPEARALKVLHDLCGRSAAFEKIWRAADGTVNFSKPLTPRVIGLAQAPEPLFWVVLDRQQAGAWEALLRSMFDEGISRTALREGSRAPWPWPPRVDGTLSPASGQSNENENREGERNDGSAND